MLTSIYPCLRERANLAFGQYRKQSSDFEKIKSIFLAAVKDYRGVAISESHGRYAYPLFIKEIMPDWAKLNVTRFYTEMIPASQQHVLDKWQDHGDEKGIVDYFDTRYSGYSKKMWAHYWLMLQAAHENDIRIVGLDNPEIRSGYGAVFDSPFKTMYWESLILKDQRNVDSDARYVVYGGEDHLIDRGGELKGIHQRLDIPRILMREGECSISSHPLDKRPSFEIRIPQALHQDPSYTQPIVRNNPVKWGV